MLDDKLKKIIEGIRVQYLPDGSIELLSPDEAVEEEMGYLFDENPNISGMTLEKSSEMLIFSRLTSMIYLKITVPSHAYNIGILTAVTGKIFDEIRTNAMNTISN